MKLLFYCIYFYCFIVLGKCLEHQGVDYEIVQTGNESSVDITPYEVLNRNAVGVFKEIGLWSTLQRYAYPLKDLVFEISPKKPHPISRTLAVIPFNKDSTDDNGSYSISGSKLRQSLNTNSPLKKKITNILEKEDHTSVIFQGGGKKQYSVVVFADGTMNPMLREFKKRRPSEFRNELSSIVISRDEYDTDSIVDLYVFGKRVIVTPISSSELQVTFHELCEQVPPSPFTRQVPISSVIDHFGLEQSSEDVGSMQTVLQRIVALPKSRTAFTSNPRYFNVDIPIYNNGVILTYPCRRKTVDVSGVITSYQIEECYHLAKSIAKNNSPASIAKDFESKVKSKEVLATGFCQKITGSAIYQTYFNYFFLFFRTILNHQIFGRLNSKFNNATSPITK